MAAVWQRDGVKLTFDGDGKVAVEIDVAAVTAAAELKPLGKVRVYEVDVRTLGRNVAREAGRLVKKIRKAGKKGKR